MKLYCVYIVTNRYHGTLYVGVTNNLQHRMIEHRESRLDGFTKQYGLNRLVFFQIFGTAYDAINFEKRLKRWHRDWKINLVDKENPSWEDLYDKIFEIDGKKI